MRYLIDGYNLMHAAGLMRPRFGPGGLERARRALVAVLAGSLGEDAARTTVVFDARVAPAGPSGVSSIEHLPAAPFPASVVTGRGESSETAAPAGGIRVEFASDDEDADARLEKLIRADSTPKQLTVVSTDRRVRVAAKRRGAISLDSDSFWSRVVERRPAPARKDATNPADDKPGRARRESEFWLSEFEDLISDDDLREVGGHGWNETEDLQ